MGSSNSAERPVVDVLRERRKAENRPPFTARIKEAQPAPPTNEEFSPEEVLGEPVGFFQRTFRGLGKRGK
ncbi:MAG: hypothetical protein KGH93_02970 [Patescibacteria group bacterium]|nr:hypothetical protein [Patescibacteria group bacterium]MDE1946132.1 hypothetical protein [Patescibacteria group bacterium]